MSAGNANIVIEQGSDHSLDIQFTSGGVPVDLTGCIARGAVKKSFSDSTPLLTYVFTPVDLTIGKFKMSITKENISNVDISLLQSINAKQSRTAAAVHDMEIVFPDSTVKRFVEGQIVFSKEVTTP